MFLEINPVLGHVLAVAAPRGKELDEGKALLRDSVEVVLAKGVDPDLLLSCFNVGLLRLLLYLFCVEFIFDEDRQTKIVINISFITYIFFFFENDHLIQI